MPSEMDEKKLDESVSKVIEYCSAELCLSASEMEVVLNHAASEVEVVLVKRRGR